MIHRGDSQPERVPTRREIDAQAQEFFEKTMEVLGEMLEKKPLPPDWEKHVTKTSDEINKITARNLKQGRRKCGLTVEEIASRAGIPVDMYVAWERGDAEACECLDVPTFFRIAFAMGIAPSKLCKGL